MLHSLKHYKALHACNVFLSVEYADVPTVDPERRVSCEPFGNDAWRVIARFGFMEGPDVIGALERRIPPAGSAWWAVLARADRGSRECVFLPGPDLVRWSSVGFGNLQP